MPSRTVRIRPILSALRSLCSSAWCAQVTVVPEVSRISVLNSGRWNGSSVSMPFGGQMPPVKAARRYSIGVAGEQRDVEIDPEPGDEEHHLRGDEQDHAVALADRHDAGVVAVLGLVMTSRPPGQHGVEDAEQADAEQIGPEMQAADRRSFIQMMPPTAMTKALTEPTSGQGLGADEMVVVVRLGMDVGHVASSLVLSTLLPATCLVRRRRSRRQPAFGHSFGALGAVRWLAAAATAGCGLAAKNV